MGPFRPFRHLGLKNKRDPAFATRAARLWNLRWEIRGLNAEALWWICFISFLVPRLLFCFNNVRISRYLLWITSLEYTIWIMVDWCSQYYCSLQLGITYWGVTVVREEIAWWIFCFGFHTPGSNSTTDEISLNYTRHNMCTVWLWPFITYNSQSLQICWN